MGGEQAQQVVATRREDAALYQRTQHATATYFNQADLKAKQFQV